MKKYISNDPYLQSLLPILFELSPWIKLEKDGLVIDWEHFIREKCNKEEYLNKNFIKFMKDFFYKIPVDFFSGKFLTSLELNNIVSSKENLILGRLTLGRNSELFFSLQEEISRLIKDSSSYFGFNIPFKEMLIKHVNLINLLSVDFLSHEFFMQNSLGFSMQSFNPHLFLSVHDGSQIFSEIEDYYAENTYKISSLFQKMLSLSGQINLEYELDAVFKESSWKSFVEKFISLLIKDFKVGDKLSPNVPERIPFINYSSKIVDSLKEEFYLDYLYNIKKDYFSSLESLCDDLMFYPFELNKREYQYAQEILNNIQGLIEIAKNTKVKFESSETSLTLNFDFALLASDLTVELLHLSPILHLLILSIIGVGNYKNQAFFYWNSSIVAIEACRGIMGVFPGHFLKEKE